MHDQGGACQGALRQLDSSRPFPTIAAPSAAPRQPNQQVLQIFAQRQRGRDRRGKIGLDGHAEALIHCQLANEWVDHDLGDSFGFRVREARRTAATLRMRLNDGHCQAGL